jgi:hypothetical protein
VDGLDEMIIERLEELGITNAQHLATAGRVLPSADGSSRPGVPLPRGSPSSGTETSRAPLAAHSR